jgi:hypothetical protein
MQLRKMTELEQRMTDDFDWAMHAAEVQQNPEHYGKFVVVYNEQILGVGSDGQALVEQAAQQAGVPRQRLVVLIVHRPESFLLEVPH